jgi:hypothetical protein
LQIQAKYVKFGLRDLDFVLTMVRSNLKESTILNHGAGSPPKATLGILFDTMFSPTRMSITINMSNSIYKYVFFLGGIMPNMISTYTKDFSLEK